jgi:hypothetical protein
MTNIHAIIFGIMLSWTPSLMLLALLLCREGVSSKD